MTRHGEDVTLFDPWREHLDAMREHGLTLEGVQGEHRVQVDAHHVDDLPQFHGAFDVVIIAVKSYDTPWTVEQALPCLAPSDFIVSPQNGVNEEQIAPVAGADRMLGCVTTISAELIGPGRVRQTGSASQSIGSGYSFTLGELDGRVTSRLHEAAMLWEHAGVTRITDNLWGERWCKLAVNCIAGMTGFNNWEIRANDDSRALMFKLAAEAVRVGRTLGYSIPPPVRGLSAAELERAAWEGLPGVERQFVGPAPQVPGRPSLLQDVLRGRKTEIDYLNGYVVRRGRAIGVDSPYSRATVDVIKAVEAGEFPLSVENIARVNAIADSARAWTTAKGGGRRGEQGALR